MHDAAVFQKYGCCGKLCGISSEYGPNGPTNNLLFRLTQGINCLERLHECESKLLGEAISYYNAVEKDHLRPSFAYWSPRVLELVELCGSLAGSIVQSQNCLPRALAEISDVSACTHKSFNKFMKAIEKSVLPIEMNQILKEYWNNSGERARDLRDKDQHYYVDISNCRCTIAEKVDFVLEFREASFGTVNYPEFICKCFWELISCIEKCLEVVPNLTHGYVETSPGIDLYFENDLGPGIILIKEINQSPPVVSVIELMTDGKIKYYTLPFR